MPVIWVLLVHHVQLINLARRVRLDRRELELCSTTLSVVLKFAWNRTITLAGRCPHYVSTQMLRSRSESFRQQGLDVNAKFSTFYGGLVRLNALYLAHYLLARP